MKLEIKKYPDPVLKQKTAAIKQIDEALLLLIQDMKETLGQEQEGGIKSIALAAPQVGVSQKIIVVASKKGAKAFFNPEIISASRKKEKDQEGCLSFPGLWLEIVRSSQVEIKALDEKGQEIKFPAQGFLARVFQHEIDHLNSVLFFERLGFFERIKVKRKLNSRYAAT